MQWDLLLTLLVALFRYMQWMNVVCCLRVTVKFMFWRHSVSLYCRQMMLAWQQCCHNCFNCTLHTASLVKLPTSWRSALVMWSSSDSTVSYWAARNWLWSVMIRHYIDIDIYCLLLLVIETVTSVLRNCVCSVFSWHLKSVGVKEWSHGETSVENIMTPCEPQEL